MLGVFFQYINFNLYCSACLARSINMELITTSSMRMSTILCLASSMTVHLMHVLALTGSNVALALQIEGHKINMYQSGDQITIGSMVISTVAFFHENWGSNIESHG